MSLLIALNAALRVGPTHTRGSPPPRAPWGTAWALANRGAHKGSRVEGTKSARSQSSGRPGVSVIDRSARKAAKRDGSRV